MSVDATFTDTVHMSAATWAAATNKLAINASFVVSGFEVTDGGSLNATVGDGFAIVNGIEVNITTNTTQALANNDTNYIWLSEAGVLADEVAGANPGSDLLIAKVVTSGGTISSITHMRSIGADPDGTRQDTDLCVALVKTADESVSSSTTVQADDDLTFTVANGEVWEVTCILECEQNAGTVDFKSLLHAGSGSVAGSCMTLSASDATTGSEVGGQFNDFATTAFTVQHTATTANIAVFIRSILFATAGSTTINLRWAQGSSSGSATLVKAGSIMIARRITG